MEEKEIKSFLKILQRARELAKKFHINNNFAGIENNLQPELIIKSSRMDEVVRADVEKIEKVKLAPFLKNFLSVPCYKPWFHITIKCDGRVTSCDVPTENGDNIKHKHLEDVWKGEYFSWLRKTLKSRNIPEFCSQCNASHTSQRRKMRLEILKELEPKAFKKLCEIYGAF
jgi:radical SAM protein with 4Fe4S-binding SPASM domain